MENYKLDTEKDLLAVLRNLLEEGIVEGIAVQTRGENGTFSSLVTDPECIMSAAPLAPLFSSNIAIHLKNNGLKKIAAVVKPCEARAISELKKLHQIKADTLITICADCIGTFDPREDVGPEPLTDAVMKDLSDKSITMRNACTVCEHFTPPDVDISIFTLGIGNGFLLATEKPELLKGMELKRGEIPGERDNRIESLLKERIENKDNMIRETAISISSPGSLVDLLKHCLRCDNCRDVCPICYCKECYFETPLGDLKTDEMLNQAALKGIVRIPPDILFYHFTRNIHVAASCVECGACEEACPRDIPLLGIWKSIAGDVQSLFDYVSGMRNDEQLPLTVFKESELEEES